MLAEPRPQAAGGAEQFPRQVEHAAAARFPAGFPGRGARGQGEGKPSHSGQLQLQGPPAKRCSSSQKFDSSFLKGLEKLLTTVDDVRVDLIKGLFSCWQRCAP